MFGGKTNMGKEEINKAQYEKYRSILSMHNWVTHTMKSTKIIQRDTQNYLHNK